VQGIDEPVKTQAIVGSAVPGLKFTFSKQIEGDTILAASYDFKQQKPELTLCWTGETFRWAVHRCCMLLHALLHPVRPSRSVVGSREEPLKAMRASLIHGKHWCGCCVKASCAGAKGGSSCAQRRASTQSWHTPGWCLALHVMPSPQLLPPLPIPSHHHDSHHCQHMPPPPPPPPPRNTTPNHCQHHHALHHHPASPRHREKASMVISADPIDRRMKISAGLSTPGPEWRVTVYDEDRGVVEPPADDGGRHRLYVEHEIRGSNLLAATRLGCKLDIGRLVNYAADFIDYNVQPVIPNLLWRIPLTRVLYNVVIPAEDERQVRHNIKGWDLQLVHDFERTKPRVALAKRVAGTSLAVGYDLEEESVAVSLERRGARVVAQLGKQAAGWRNPSIHFMVEPLALL
jgi:hypothetical protein